MKIFIFITIILVVVNSNEDFDFWFKMGMEGIEQSLKNTQPNNKIAKNIILFIGDGMSLATVSASRIFKAQQIEKDFKRPESNFLTFEKFHHLGLSKTYSVDYQTPDSSSTASAMFSGIKTNFKTMGFDSSIIHENMNSMNTAKKVETILSWAQGAGKSTGFVTTARITHATPAALYAHTYDRNWECDAKFDGGLGLRNPPQGTFDIAYQLINKKPGNATNVILGGGYPAFYPFQLKQQLRQKYGNRSENWECFRKDGQYLVNQWLNDHGPKGKFVSNSNELESIAADDTDFLMGLFSESHLEYEDSRHKSNNPSLSQMTAKAFEILNKNENGFFLMVEAGRIDHAHHETTANRALSETVALDKAVETILDKLGADQEESLIIVTADHSHTMTISGYSKRGNDIRGLNTKLMDDNLPYTTLSYANGKGFYYHNMVDKSRTHIIRKNLSKIPIEDILSPNFIQTSSGPLNSETHGGDDVPIYAHGPMSHLFHGTHEQTHIAYVMAFSGCLGPFIDHPRCAKAYTNEGNQLNGFLIQSIFFIILIKLIN